MSTSPRPTPRPAGSGYKPSWRRLPLGRYTWRDGSVILDVSPHELVIAVFLPDGSMEWYRTSDLSCLFDPHPGSHPPDGPSE